MLILGGARSGKSRHALELAKKMPAPYVFVATAEAHDAEMKERICRHRSERGSEWRTIEAPIALADAIDQAPTATVLIDCCTIWLSNIMLAGRDTDGDMKRLIAAIRGSANPIVMVSNEVGYGIVPDTPLGRRFRDVHGRMNQRLAEISETVELVVAGIPLRIKG
ncbi:bifunctional adenosylcobinamide kinase/adenosylcobinamide-phosphate guanylyltransferase [Parasphingopyxis sp.]|uniref:bifunctional adenosylcobinamide kinase/adenosylcobinamide-phosphate guanylyltransferase n=1 Tax=Parasphingopyxis sp. TaxID=1920299 RepID=UPI0034590E56